MSQALSSVTSTVSPARWRRSPRWTQYWRASRVSRQSLHERAPDGGRHTLKASGASCRPAGADIRLEAGQGRTQSNVSATPMSGCTMPWHGRAPGDEIGPGEVHLWRARHAALAEPPRLDCLDPAEQQRARRMVMPSQRKAFGFARAMLRVVLGAYL